MLIPDNMRNTAILAAQDDAQKAAIHRQRAAPGVRGWPGRHPLEPKRCPPVGWGLEMVKGFGAGAQDWGSHIQISRNVLRKLGGFRDRNITQLFEVRVVAGQEGKSAYTCGDHRIAGFKSTKTKLRSGRFGRVSTVMVW
jgi:hypothetical protein